jgi:hypothetical protein
MARDKQPDGADGDALLPSSRGSPLIGKWCIAYHRKPYIFQAEAFCVVVGGTGPGSYLVRIIASASGEWSRTAFRVCRACDMVRWMIFDTEEEARSWWNHYHPPQEETPKRRR